MTKTATHLQKRLLAFIGGAAGDFDALALEVFEFQRAHNPTYRAYCERRQIKVMYWQNIPAVPTSAFKEFPLACFPVKNAVAEFHTSGTTRTAAGKHYFKTLELYHGTSQPNFNAHLMPDSTHLPALALTPSPTEAPHSSLAHMLGVVGSKDLEFFVERNTLLLERLTQRLCEMQWSSQPVLLLGTAFAFVQLFDYLGKLRFDLPEGSRAMETGGFKGRVREVTKPELYRRFTEQLGIPAHRIVNEYGMTELSTQFYDETMRIGRQSDRKTVPPWARVMVIDPRTGMEAPAGERGLLRIFDLANLWSAACIQTEDLGIAHDDGTFEVLGRVAGAEVRGCSLTTEKP